MGELAWGGIFTNFSWGKKNLSTSPVEPWPSRAAANEKLALRCRKREARRSAAFHCASAHASSEEWKTPLRTEAGPQGARVRARENCGEKSQ